MPATQPASYLNEQSLVEDLLSAITSQIDSPWGGLEFVTEWDYRDGCLDVLARSPRGQLIAFEAKLRDWKRALHQSYRATFFSNLAYVAMPAREATAAAQRYEMFLGHGVGLCAVEGGFARILIHAPEHQNPLLPWVGRKAHEHLDKSGSHDRPSRPRRNCETNLRTARW